MANSKEREYVVTLSGPDGGLRELIIETTPNRAALTAVKMNPGACAQKVECEWLVVGTCDKCRAVVLDNEKWKERGDRLLCEDCT